jgi:hypothetical protein
MGLLSNRGVLNQVGEFIEITTDQSSLQTVGIQLVFAAGNLKVDWGDGSPMEDFVTGVELTHNYLSTSTYDIKIKGDLENITQFIADNSRITFIKNMISGLLTNFSINNNLYSGVLDMSLAPTSGVFRVDQNAGMTGIVHATLGNALITNYQYDGNDIQGNLDLTNQPVGGSFFGNNNSSHTGVDFANSGNTKITGLRLHDCDLDEILDLTNVPVGTLIYTYNNPNFPGFTFSSTGNSVVTDFRNYGCALTSLDLTNVPVGNIFWNYDNFVLSSLTFSASGNTALLQAYLDDNILPNIDFSVFPSSTPTIRLFNNSMTALEHDNQLINLDGTGWTGGTLAIIPGNTARTAASDTAYNNLIANGWTIT